MIANNGSVEVIRPQNLQEFRSPTPRKSCLPKLAALSSLNQNVCGHVSATKRLVSGQWAPEIAEAFRTLELIQMLAELPKDQLQEALLLQLVYSGDTIPRGLNLLSEDGRQDQLFAL